MTRILFWNLDAFSVDVVHGRNVARGGFGVGAASSAAEARRTAIGAILTRIAPEIIVVTGFATDRTLTAEAGQLMTGPGLDGLRLLISQLRTRSASAWAMTPPVRSSASDGVAILYNTDRLVFAGPFGWSGGIAGVSMDVAVSTPRDYPPAFASLLPQGRTVPAGAPVNAGQSEARMALRATGYTTLGGRTAFPDAYFAGTADVRAPVLAAFAETGAAGAFERMVYVAAIRAPEHEAEAQVYNPLLAQLDALEPALTGTDAIAIAGSFGENIYDTGTGALARSFEPLAKRGFVNGFAATPMPADRTLWGFYTTVIRPAAEASYYSTPGAPLVYPAYGYGGPSDKPFSVDTILVKSAAPTPPDTAFTIVNPVVGAPYTALAGEDWPPPKTFTGAMAMDALATSLLPLVKERPEATVSRDWTEWFQSDDQYARIGGISGHLPVAADV